MVEEAVQAPGVEMVRPILDHILVQPSTEDTTSEGGIIVPENARTRPAKGKVVAKGPGRRTDHGILIPMSVIVGDIVHYNKYTGVEVTLGGLPYLMMRDDDVLAVEQEEAPW